MSKAEEDAVRAEMLERQAKAQERIASTLDRILQEMGQMKNALNQIVHRIK